MSETPENTDKIEKVERINGKFAPGVSGNPAGKPKGAKHLSTMLWEALQERAKNKDGTLMDKTHADLVISRLIKDNIEKGSRTELIFDRIDGQARAEIDFTSNGETLTTGQDLGELARKVAEELKKKKTS